MFNFKSFAVAGALVIAFGSAAIAGNGGVDNGDFETGLPGTWLATGGAARNGGNYQSSNHSVKFDSLSSLSQIITNLAENTKYTLSFSVLTNNTSFSNLFGYALVGGTTGTLGTTGGTIAMSSMSTSVWTLVTLDFTTANNPIGDYVSTLLSFGIGRLPGGKKVFLDDVSIVAVKAPPPPTDVPGPIAGAGIPALIAGGVWLARRRKQAV